VDKWEEFEVDCVNYLRKIFGNSATFDHQGKSNSTIPDIEVITNKNKQFYIEVKLSPAQCGQFVLFANESTRTFTYSARNKSLLNQHSQKIIDFMNNNFTRFLNAGTAGEEIDIDDHEELFANWIIDKYQKMNVKYIITNDFIILNLKDLLKYFKIKATYRIKQSGSIEPAKKDIEKIAEILKNMYDITEYEIENKKMFIKSNKDLDKHRFEFKNFNYQIKKRENRYEVRKLSHTRNLNVIFNIVLKSSVIGISISEFKKILLED